MKKLLALATLSVASSFAAAESYQVLGNVGISDSDIDGADSVITAGGTYYFSGQETVGPLDQFSYIDDTTNVRAAIASSDGADGFSIGGSYYTGSFAFGVDYLDIEDASMSRFHGDYFISKNLKVSLGYSMPDGVDNFLDLSVQYDHAINDQDYIGFTLAYTDTEESVLGLSTKYFNALGNGQFLVVEASMLDADDTAMEASIKWYLNQNTGFIFGADDDDYKYIGATHFVNTNFALDVTVGQDKVPGGDSYTNYNLNAVLQF